MTTYALRRTRGRADDATGVDWGQFRWLAMGLVAGFLVPFIFTALLGVQKDVYYGLFSAFAIGLFVLWARATGAPLERMVRRRWILAVTLGLAAAAGMAFIVLRTEDATTRPGGFELVAAVVWRGLLYGVADGVLLSAFPILVVFAAFSSSPLSRRRLGRLAIGIAALTASLAMTASYHLGYSDFRSAKVRSPLAGDVIWGAPTLLTLNPIGAPIAHAGLHITAVLHSYETDVFLPPHETKTQNGGQG